MPILPSGGARFIEQNGGSAQSLSNLVLRKTSSVGSTDFYDFTTGAADLEMVDVSSTGVYTTPAAGSSPSAPRLIARGLAGGNIIVY